MSCFLKHPSSFNASTKHRGSSGDQRRSCCGRQLIRCSIRLSVQVVLQYSSQLNTSRNTVKMSTESNSSLLATSNPYALRSPSIGVSIGMGPSTRAPDAGFFPVEQDDNIVGDPSQRIYFQPFCQDPSYGDLPPSFQNPEIQCTCPLFSISPTADSPAASCGKHDLPSPASVSDQKTLDHTSDRSGESHSLKRKCLSIANALKSES